MTELTIILAIAICLFILYLVNCGCNMNALSPKSNFVSTPINAGSSSTTQIGSLNPPNGTMHNQ